MTDNKITKEAHAKINLGLDVLRKREDGYHEVKMIMQTIGLSDTLTFEMTKENDIVIESDSGKIPLDEHNLIYKAARVFFEETGQAFGIKVYLNKRIPIAAGMAGGSTDAAATFLALNEISGQPLSLEKLKEMLCNRFSEINFENAKQDVLPFIKDPSKLNLWNKDFFSSVTLSQLK